MSPVEGGQQCERKGNDAGADKRIAWQHTRKLVCSFHCGCLHLGSSMRAELSSLSPSSAPCHRNRVLV